MKPPFYVFLIIPFQACNSHHDPQEMSVEKKDSLVVFSSTATSNDSTFEMADQRPIPAIFKLKHPSVTGDFDGDGQPDTLQTRLYSKRDKKLINELSEDCEMGCICAYEPLLYLKAKDASLPVLYFDICCQVYGISKLANVGDINSDGSDEIAVIINFASYSGLNTCYLYGICNGAWKELFSFRISDLEDWSKNKNDVSEFIFWKDSNLFYNELEPDDYYTKKLTGLKKCGE